VLVFIAERVQIINEVAVTYRLVSTIAARFPLVASSGHGVRCVSLMLFVA
jgi:hypothetical protein